MRYFYVFRIATKTRWRDLWWSDDQMAIAKAPLLTSSDGVSAAWYRITNEHGRVVAET